MNKLLIVDDSKFARLSIKRIFQDKFKIVEASSGHKALEILNSKGNRIDVMILDMFMDGMNGSDVLTILRSNQSFSNFPVIAMSGDVDTQLEALKAGAWDFFSKDEAADVMRVRVENVLERSHSITYQRQEKLSTRVLSIVMNITQDMMFEWHLDTDTLESTGHYAEALSSGKTISNFTKRIINNNLLSIDDYKLFLNSALSLTPSQPSDTLELRLIKGFESPTWFRCTMKGEFNAEGKLTSVLGLLRNIQQYKSAIYDATIRAETDGLTGLLNRSSFERLVSADMTNPETHSAFILIDVDNFKMVNDTMGHLVGDKVLQVIASRIRKSFRDSDYVARMGGDEFAVYMRDFRNRGNLISKIDKMISEIRKPINSEKGNFYQYISIGACYIEPNSKYRTFVSAYKAADDALYVCKGKGKNCYNVVYE